MAPEGDHQRHRATRGLARLYRTPMAQGGMQACLPACRRDWRQWRARAGETTMIEAKRGVREGLVTHHKHLGSVV